MIRRFLIIVVFSCSIIDIAAQPLKIGEWNDHLPYHRGVSVTEGGGKVYCATQGGLFSYSKNDNSFEQLNKINGFSDIGISKIAYNKYNNVLLIAYKNGNIDLVENNTITNISDLKNKSITGNKTINSICFVNENAYLGCGFGILVLNTNKKEIKDTYYIGANGSEVNVRSIAIDSTSIYAATEQGIFSAPFKSSFLADFKTWNKFTTIPNGIYNTIAAFKGKVYAGFSKREMDDSWIQDSIFVFDGTSWSHFNPASGYVIYNINAYNDKLVITFESFVDTYDTTITRINHVYSYSTFESYIQARDAVLDENDFLWIADLKFGLIKNWATWGAETVAPSGPNTTNSYALSISGNSLWSVPGVLTDLLGNSYNRDGVSCLKNDTWTNYYEQQSIANFDTIIDIISIVADPKDETHAFAGSWSKGLLEFKNGALAKIYNESNSTLQSRQGAFNGQLNIGGMAFDVDNNLWVANSEVDHLLNVRKANGTWKAFDFSAFITENTVVGNLIVTTSNQKWLVLPGSKGILVYNDEGTFAQPNSSNTKKINSQEGNGGLPTNNVYCVAEDLDGAVWVGTDKGIAVFYSPGSIFGGNNWDAKQILIEQDGHVQILLGTEEITAIAVDGANRKWIGTAKSGVFLMSADGTVQIYHFNEENSPLFSNSINDISINHKTGEVFFATVKGIISFKSTATEGGEDFEEVYAYPNPVKEDYNGLIAIKGLVKDASVKITDVAGNLIYSTKALGGQAIWDGKNFKGEKAHTGVYFVYCSNDDGSKTHVAKIMIIN